MRFLIATLGSAGDLHPFLAIARALNEAGQETHFASQESHRAEVEAQGLRFHAIATDHDYQRMLAHPAFWHPLRGFGVLWRYLVVPSIAPTITLIQTLLQLQPDTPEELTVFASPLVLGARLAREQTPFRLVHGHTAPAHLRSNQDPLFIAGRRIPTWLPHSLREFAWKWLDSNKLDPMAAPAIQKWLKDRHLPEAPACLFAAWLYSPDAHLALFPQDFGPMPTDWPIQPTFTGFPLYQTDHKSSLTPDLLEFIARQSVRPVTIYPGPGTSVRLTEFQQLAQRIVAAGIPCIWLSQQANPALAHPLLFRTAQQPMTNLLAQSQAIIHHGGIGTCAQGLAKKLHQTILPAAYDQHDNAARVAHVQQSTTEPNALPQYLSASRKPVETAAPKISESLLNVYSKRNAPNNATKLAAQALQTSEPK